MIGLTGLPRTGQYPQAIDFIEHNETFTYTNEDYQKALEKCKNVYGKKYERLAKDMHKIEEAVNK